MKDRAYLHKDITDLTPEDLQEMAEDFQAEEDAKARMDDLQEQEAELEKQRAEKATEFATATVNAAIAQYLKTVEPEALKDALNATLDAFHEYAKTHGGTVHGFFRDPELPEILREIRTRALDILREQMKKHNIPAEDMQEYMQRRDLANINIFATGKKFLPAYGSQFVQEFTGLTKQDFKRDPQEGRNRIASTSKGDVILRNSDGLLADFLESCGPMQAKLVIAGLIVFAANNHYDHGDAKNTLVELNLYDFAEKNERNIVASPGASDEERELARNRCKDYKHELRGTLQDLANMEWYFTAYGGDFRRVGIIQPSFSVTNGIIRYRFDQEFANMLKYSGYIEQRPIALFNIKNSMPNAFRMALKVATHHSNDRNAARGTESTLSVRKFIEYAPMIQTFEELRSKGRKDWRKQIKERLETNFEELKRADYWERWEYRDPRTGAIYTAESAAKLPAAGYEALMVDYVVKDAPDQTERRARRTAERKEREAQAIAEGKTPKKRGRPRKTANTTT